MAGGLWALLSALGYGVGGICARRGQPGRPHDSGMFMTTLANVTCFAALVALELKGGQIGPGSWVAAGIFLGSGVLTTLIGRTCFYEAVRHIGPSRSSSFKCSSPIVTVVAAFLFLGDHLTAVQGGGMLCVVGGLWLLTRDSGRLAAPGGSAAPPPVAGGSGVVPSLGERLHLSPGVLFGLTSAFSFGIGLTLRKVGLLYWPSPATGGLLSMSMAMVGVSATHARAGKLGQVVRENFSRANGWYFGAAAATSIAAVASFTAFNLTQASIAAVLSGTEPIWTTIIAAVVLGAEERLTARTVSAIGLAFVGAVALVAG